MVTVVRHILRQQVFKRDGGACVYCGSAEELTLDHVIPRSAGGKMRLSNLVTACRVCNHSRSVTEFVAFAKSKGKSNKWLRWMMNRLKGPVKRMRRG